MESSYSVKTTHKLDGPETKLIKSEKNERLRFLVDNKIRISLEVQSYNEILINQQKEAIKKAQISTNEIFRWRAVS
jgi:hypothetical protein